MIPASQLLASGRHLGKHGYFHQLFFFLFHAGFRYKYTKNRAYFKIERVFTRSRQFNNEQLILSIQLPLPTIHHAIATTARR
jgi:hypothetical protein